MALTNVPGKNIINYYYIGNKIDLSTLSNQSISSKVNTKTNNDTFNPLFNFDSTFSNNLNSLTPIDLGLAVPYVDIKLLSLDGTVIDDLNISFFQKQIDFSNINDKTRYSDRPVMSLDNVEFSTDQASRLSILRQR